jgi:hypothetical protein
MLKAIQNNDVTVQYLVTQGADVTVDDNYAVRWASPTYFTPFFLRFYFLFHQFKKIWFIIYYQSDFHQTTTIMSAITSQRFIVTTSTRWADAEEEEEMNFELYGCKCFGCDNTTDGTISFCSEKCTAIAKRRDELKSLEGSWVRFKTDHPCHGCGVITIYPYCTGCTQSYEQGTHVCSTFKCKNRTTKELCKRCFTNTLLVCKTPACTQLVKYGCCRDCRDLCQKSAR